jgi:hypothetical protein
MLKWFKRDKSKKEAETPDDKQDIEESPETAEAVETNIKTGAVSYEDMPFEDEAEAEESIDYNYADVEEYDSVAGYGVVEELEPDFEPEPEPA